MDDDQCDLDELTALLDSDHDELNEDDVQLAAVASEMESEMVSDGNCVSSASQRTISEDADTAVTPSTAQTDAELLAELKMMQEKIRLLEARLCQNNPVSELPPPKTPSIKTSFISETSVESKTVSKVTTLSVETSRDSKPATPRVIKDNETDNMFFAKKGIRVAHGSTNKGAHSTSDRAHDSDSDWEGLDGEPGNDLSAAGRQMNSLLKSKSTYQPVGSDSFRNSVAPTKTSATRTNSPWDDKASVSYTSSLIGMPLPSSSSTVSKRSVPKDSSKDGADIFKEPQSGVRMIKPQVSSERLKTLMEGRRLIRLSILHQKARGSDIDGDWVTIAVIVGKSEPKVSAKGSKYSIWRLSDLGDCDKVVSLFLFAKVHNDLWKTSIGSVIGILNASVMQNTEKYQSNDNNDVSITVDTSQKVLFMGQSKDLGTCQGFTKAGKQCSNFVNVNMGGYCTYHVQAAYKKCSNKRAELQVTYSGIVPKTAANKKVRGSGSVFYGGKDYSLSERSKPKKSISLEHVNQHRSRLSDSLAPVTSISACGSSTTFVRSVGEALNMSAVSKTVNSLQSATFSSDKKYTQTLSSNKNSAVERSAAKMSQASRVSTSSSIEMPSAIRASASTSFQEALSGKSSTDRQVSALTSSDETLSGNSAVGKKRLSTASSINKSLSAEKPVPATSSLDKSQSANSSAEKTVPATSSFEKVSPGSLSSEKHWLTNAHSKKLVFPAPSSRQTSTSSADVMARKPETEDNTLFLDLLTVPTAGARCFMKHLEVQEKVLTEVIAPSDKEGSKPVARKSSSATSVLRDFEKTLKHKKLAGSSVPQLGRGLAADSEIMIDLDDISLPKSSSTDHAKLKAIAKVKSIGGIVKQDPNSVKKSFTSPEVQRKISKRVRTSTDEKDTSENVSVGSKDGTLPAKKKSRMLGNVDLNSSEIQKLINAKSSHTALVDEMEVERQEEYFSTMEKTEKMENKMDSVREVKCTAFSCSQCKYTALAVGDRCKSEGHHIKTHKATKRFFRCKECSWRTTSLDKIPTVACSKCGSSNFERTSMLNHESKNLR